MWLSSPSHLIFSDGQHGQGQARIIPLFPGSSHCTSAKLSLRIVAGLFWPCFGIDEIHMTFFVVVLVAVVTLFQPAVEKEFRESF